MASFPGAVAAANTAAVAAAQAVASPMPVRQMQFSSFRPSLPQQSRLVSFQPAPGFEAAPCHTPSPHQLQAPAPAQQHQLQQQAHAQHQQSTDSSLVRPHAAAVGAVSTDVSCPLASLPADAQAGQAAEVPPAIVQSPVLPPATISLQMPYAASSTVASVPAAPHQQQQLLLHQVAPVPHITWPHPVVSWPHELKQYGDKQAGIRQKEGIPPHARVHAPPCLAPPMSAPLQGIPLDGNRALGFAAPPAGLTPQHEVASTPTGPLPPSLPPVGSALLQGVIPGPKQPPGAPDLPAGSASTQGDTPAAVGPSLPPAGSASLQGVTPAAVGPFPPPTVSAFEGAPTMAPAGGSVPSGVAEHPKYLWEGAQGDAHATIQTNAVPPNKR